MSNIKEFVHIKQRLMTHFWLKNSDDRNYHAYDALNRSSLSVCGESSLKVHANNMHIPSTRSMCCLKCMDELYGTNLSLQKETRDE
jgi:hypothetical protein